MSAQKQSRQENQQQESQLCSDILSSPKLKHNEKEIGSHQAQFQKNYPKNIFIPLIEYLTQMGYKQAYEKCVGSRGDFQGKNVVSLSSIYTLITQDWFYRNINKEGALAHICNKILINSKIKKKLFHLLMANIILMERFADLRDFKRRVSKQANGIGKRPLPHDDLFNYPNAIIYLLYLFLKILMLHASKKGYLKLEQQLQKLSLQQASGAEPKGKNTGSKQEYKFYVKQVVHVLNGKNLQIHSLTDILQQTKQSILEKDKLLREKYQLIDGIPNWIYFIDRVVVRCFQYKRKDMKITNFILNEWINDCKTKMLSIFPTQTQSQIKVTNAFESSGWETGALEWKHNKFSFSTEKWNAGPQFSPNIVKNQNESNQMIAKASKEFTPIILSKLPSK